jgi:hypothetical protein
VVFLCFWAEALEKLESGRRTSEESLKEIGKNRAKLEETLKKLNEIFPGPGGESPKAYAW